MEKTKGYSDFYDMLKLIEALGLLIDSREKAIAKLLKIADYIKSVQSDKNIAKISGTSAGIMGAIVGSGIAALCTGGLATPILVASIAGTSAAVAGAGVGIGAEVVSVLK